MVLKIVFISLFSLLILKTTGDSLYEKNLKKTHKTINKLWADEEVTLNPISLNSQVLSQNGIKPIEVYALKNVNAELPEAYICLHSPFWWFTIWTSVCDMWKYWSTGKTMAGKSAASDSSGSFRAKLVLMDWCLAKI